MLLHCLVVLFHYYLFNLVLFRLFTLLFDTLTNYFYFLFCMACLLECIDFIVYLHLILI